MARDHLQRLGDVLAQLAQSRAAAAGAGRRRGDHYPLARQVFRERLAGRLPAGERLDGRRRPGGLLGLELVLGGRSLQLFQLELHLVQQPAGAFRRDAEPLALQLGDHQLQVGDQGLVFGALGLGHGDLGLGLVAFNAGFVALVTHAGQRRPQRFDVVRNGRGHGFHDQN